MTLGRAPERQRKLKTDGLTSDTNSSWSGGKQKKCRFGFGSGGFLNQIIKLSNLVPILGKHSFENRRSLSHGAILSLVASLVPSTSSSGVRWLGSVQDGAWAAGAVVQEFGQVAELAPNPPGRPRKRAFSDPAKMRGEMVPIGLPIQHASNHGDGGRILGL